MKNTVTIAISLPKKLANNLDAVALKTNLSRSALITAMLSGHVRETKEGLLCYQITNTIDQ